MRAEVGKAAELEAALLEDTTGNDEAVQRTAISYELDRLANLV